MATHSASLILLYIWKTYESRRKKERNKEKRKKERKKKKRKELKEKKKITEKKER